MIFAAGILFKSKAGRVLLLKRSAEGDFAGYWCIPGGKIEDGENAEGAAVREVLEETGYRVGHPGRLLMRSVGEDVDYTTFIKDVDDEFMPKLNDEHTAFGWFVPSEVLDDTQVMPRAAA
jgi:8-oxo-dGTP pyrophosphatase MutT (NUDIX family)